MSIERVEVVEDGVTYIQTEIGGRASRYAKCCGWHTCTSSCKAIIHHGPGHQSSTHCRLEGDHEIHEAIYGSFRQQATWRGDEVFSGFFDEPPCAENE